LSAMHGGTVEVSSPGLGQGCEFVVRLPILEEAGAPRSRPPAAEACPSTPLRILNVDEDPDSADMLAMLLQFSGHDTHPPRWLGRRAGGRGVEAGRDLPG
jgi:hypothetical protein